MKKIISYVLLLAMALALFAGCAPKVEADPGLESAKEYLNAMYKDTNGSITISSFTRVGVVTIQGVGTYEVDWSANVEGFTITRGTNKMVTIGLPPYGATATEYTLTATIKDANNNTVSVSFNYIVPAADEITLPPVSAPVEGTAYKFGMIQVNTGKTEFITGEIDQDRYLKTTTTKAEALDVYAEASGDGYKFSTTIGGTKLYIALFLNDAGKTALGYTAEGTVFQYDSKTFCWFAALEGEKYYMGSYNNFDTISASKTSYINAENAGVSQFPAGFFDPNSISDATPETPEKPEDNTTEGGNETPSTDPAADSTLTVEQVIALGTSKEHNTYTEGKYYVTGVITEVYNEQYGNMKISDDKGNILTIYGTYDATGANRYDAMATKPVAGDTVTIYGIVGQYNGTPQVKNGWITAHTPAGSGPTDSGNTDNTNPLANGTKVVIYAPAHKKALSSKPASEGSFYQMGVDVTISGSTVTGFADTEVWTIVVNSDGSISFEQGGKKLGMQDQYSSMSLGAVNDKWEVIDLGNGLYNIKNTVRGNMIEWYDSKDNWSTYTSDKAATDPLFQMSFFIVK